MTAHDQIDLVTRIFGAAIALASAQWLVSIVQLRVELLLGWSRALRQTVVPLLLVRVAAGVCLLIFTRPSSLVGGALVVVFVSSLALWHTMRPTLHAVFRMTHLLTPILLVAHVSRDQVHVPEAALFAIAGLVSLSYLITGGTKLATPGWRSGATLLVTMKSRTNGSSRLSSWLEMRPAILRCMAWSVIVFECLFPLSLVTGKVGVTIFLVLGMVFHLGIASFMGMNLFPLTWGATYPAIWFTALHLDTVLPSLTSPSPALAALMVWLGVLTAWQLVAWVPWMQEVRQLPFQRRCQYGFYFLLYEFYMFAIRDADVGIRYRVLDVAAADDEGSAWKVLPLPWDRRFRDAFWNPEHEVKKVVRHIAKRIRSTGVSSGELHQRLADWLEASRRYPEGTRFEFRVVDQDQFATGSFQGGAESAALGTTLFSRGPRHAGTTR